MNGSTDSISVAGTSKGRVKKLQPRASEATYRPAYPVMKKCCVLLEDIKNTLASTSDSTWSRHQTFKGRRSVLKPPSETLAEREAFRGKLKQFTELYSDIKKGEDNIRGRNSFESHLSGTYSKLTQHSIEECHPGREDILKNGCLLFNAETLSFSNFNGIKGLADYSDLIEIQHKDKRTDYLDVYNRLSSGSTQFGDPISLYLLYLMSVDEELCIANWCFNILNTKNVNWNPNIQDILTIFVNWGVVDETFYPANVGDGTKRTCSFSGNPPNTTILLHNILNVLKYLTILFKRIKVDQEYLEVLLVALTKVSLEKGFSDPWLVNGCISALFTGLPDTYWTDEKVLRLSERVHDRTDHFHNQAHLCLQVLPENSVRQMLCCSVLLQILKSPIVLPASFSLEFLLSILDSHTDTSELPLYEQYTFLEVLQQTVRGIPACRTPRQRAIFQRLIGWIEASMNSLPLKQELRDVNRTKEYIGRIWFLWEHKYLGLSNVLA